MRSWKPGFTASTPPVSEIVVTKISDVSSEPLFREGDTFDFQPQLTTEPTAPEPYMQWKLNNAMVTSYQHSGSGGDLLMNADLLATPGPDVNDSSTNPSNGHRGDGGFADGHNDGGIIIDFTPGPDDNVGPPAADGLLLPY